MPSGTSSRVRDPNFKFGDAPVERERYPIPSLLVEVIPSRWMSITEDLKSELELGNPMATAVTELMAEVGAGQHRYVLDMAEVASPTEPPPPSTPESGETEPDQGLPVERDPRPGELTLTQNDLVAALSQVLAEFDEFGEMPAKTFSHLVQAVTDFVFED